MKFIFVPAFFTLIVSQIHCAPNGATDTCWTPECVQIASTIAKNMDTKVKPCDDFYRFTCGNFLKNAKIDDDEHLIHPMRAGTELASQLRSVIEEKDKPDDIKPFRFIKTLYKSCMDKTLIQKQGLEPLRKILNDLGGWPVLMGNKWIEKNFDWKNSVYNFRKIGYSMNYFIRFQIDIDSKNAAKNIIHLGQASLGLSRFHLSKGMKDNNVKSYYDYMVDIAGVLGANKAQAARELKESLEFEMKLANISKSSEELRNENVQYNSMSVRELQQKFTSIPWLEYINTLLKPITSVTENEIVIVLVPSYIANLEKLLNQTPKRVLANYAIWRAVDSSVKYLNDEIREKESVFATVLQGITKRPERWQECLKVIENQDLISIGSLYVRKYFNQTNKIALSGMVADIKQGFKKILQKNDWMDSGTRNSALRKLESMRTYIAYPDELLDHKELEKHYRKLEITPGNYLQSILNFTNFYHEYTFEQLTKPANKSDWKRHSFPTLENAFYSLRENSVEFTAAMLQGAYYDHDRPKYMNYGMIGWIIGHEISHGFDDEGRLYDKDGKLVDWWADEMERKFLNRSRCIIDQYSNYNVSEIQKTVNGNLTRSENIADNVGIKAAYMAYNEWTRRNKLEPKLPNLQAYSPQQMFWISMASTWCVKYRPEVLQYIIDFDEHSPDEFRVIGTLSNSPEFAKDFNCPVGSKMNPVKKCTILK